VLPRTGELINSQITLIGTLLGALCFLIGAILMFPAWRQAIRESSAPSPQSSRQHTTP
jgi:LPXTG-motif cell wall-anchored protein